VLVDLFSRIENFLKRLESYAEVQPTSAMTGIIIKIMIEVLTILGIATKEVKQGRSSELINVHISIVLDLDFSRKIPEEDTGKE